MEQQWQKAENLNRDAEDLVAVVKPGTRPRLTAA